MNKRFFLTAALTLAALAVMNVSEAAAQRQSHTGPVIHSAGAVYEVPAPTFATNMDQEYKVAFEIAGASSQPDRLNQSLNTVARFLNMHAQAGLPRDQVHVAVVVHGGSSFELMDNEQYRKKFGVDNPNAELIRELVSSGTPVVVCGQSAASRGIEREHLLPGVQMALSAMTAFAVLQEQGFKVNPW